MDIVESYKNFLKNGKTERECTSEIIRLAEEKGYKDINKVEKLKAGDRVYISKWNKSVALFHIVIESKTDKDGIDIRIAPFTKHESVHIPVVLTKSGFHDMVYNDFFIGEGADVTIVAGCGIHNCGSCDSEHDGIHTFYVGKNARVIFCLASARN